MVEYRVKGAFFENEKDAGPAFTGFVEIDNVKTYVALWPKTSKAGANYLQVSEDRKKTTPQTSAQPKSPFKPRVSPPATKTDMDDDIPF
jgi:hypothetical protein